MQKALYLTHNITINRKPSTTAHSNDSTDHSVTDTLPTDASNSVHHTPTDIGSTSDNIVVNSIMSSVPLATHDLLISTVVTTLYTPMGACTLLIWPMSPTSAHKPSLIPLDHLLTEEPMVDWLVLTSACLNTPNNVQTLQEQARHQLMHFHL